MSDLKDKFVFDGKLYEKNSDGTTEKVITTDNVEATGIVEVTTSESGISIGSAGIEINDDGLLCATFYEEEV